MAQTDSWPMIARCKLAQWRGLDPNDRLRLTYQWAKNYSDIGRATEREQSVRVLWGVARNDTGATVSLISIKED